MAQTVLADVAVSLMIGQRTAVIEQELDFDNFGVGHDIECADAVFTGQIKRICTRQIICDCERSQAVAPDIAVLGTDICVPASTRILTSHVSVSPFEVTVARRRSIVVVPPLSRTT